MHHAITTQPATEPVTLAQMRAHLGITQADDTTRDTSITGRIISARTWCEATTRKALITQTWTAYGRKFPDCVAQQHRIFLKSPLQSVTSVKYLDANGTQQTLDPSLYLVDTVTACITPAFNQVWPCGQEQNNAVQIEYICGFGAASAVPEPIKDAIRFIVGQWETFQNTVEGGARPGTIPYAALQLIAPYNDHREAF